MSKVIFALCSITILFEVQYKCSATPMQENEFETKLVGDNYPLHQQMPDQNNVVPSEDNTNNKENSNADNSQVNLNKLQLGVILKNSQPVGILQPFRRNYRFIPLKSEVYMEPQQPVNEDFPQYRQVMVMNKRETQKGNNDFIDKMDKSKSAVNLKIDDQGDTKRSITNPKNVDLRYSRSNVPADIQSDECVKTILGNLNREDNMNINVFKRDSSPNLKSGTSKTKNKRQEQEPLNNIKEKAGEEKKISEKEDNFDINSKLSSDDDTKELTSYLKKDSLYDNEMKKLLTTDIESNYPPNTLKVDGIEIPDPDKRIARRIHDQIQTLKEEVKRQIESLQNEDEGVEEGHYYERKKRHALNLADAENDDINPIFNSNDDSESLPRKRRVSTSLNIATEKIDPSHNRKKRAANDDNKQISNGGLNRNRLHMIGKRAEKENTETFSDLLDSDFEPEKTMKRENSPKLLKIKLRAKRSKGELFDDLLAAVKRLKRDANLSGDSNNKIKPVTGGRKRRRVDDESLDRPQQLSDFSDIDLFGALPKSYDGELSRYKRI